MEVGRYLGVVRRHWLLITISVVLSGIAAVGFTARQTPQYQASVTMFVSGTGNGTDSTSAYQASLLSQERVKSYAGLLKSGRLARDLSRTLGGGVSPAELQAKISAETFPGSVLLKATVTDSSPAWARSVADALGARFALFVDELERAPGATRAPIKVSVVDDAQEPAAPVSPRLPVNIALGLLIGLAIGLAGSMLRDAFQVPAASGASPPGDDGRRPPAVRVGWGP
ncbi:YveK family protein [Actinomadura viridis]|uniref:YveK family protein n=1 Tax=Actinomadura viridis TaxID=58110 RepID=UPI0036CF868C